jgi:hypothetical protein
MILALNRKGTVLFETSSLEKAYDGLQKGTYKVGEYSVVEPSGKVHHFVKYICERKSRRG